MNSRTLNWMLWPIAGAILGFFVSATVCGVRGFEDNETANAEVLVFGRVVHKEVGTPRSGLSERVVSTWGYALMAGFATLGAICGAGIAALVNRATRVALPEQAGRA